jgi:hypothetical protein
MASKMAASSDKYPELPHYSTWDDDFGVKPYVFRISEFIEMVNLAVEGLTDDKILDDRRFRGKTAELCYWVLSTL